MPKNPNRWERLADRAAEIATRRADRVSPGLKGGNLPPGKTRVPREEMLREYLLLCQPIGTLPPQLQAEADQIWAEKYAGRERNDIAEWCLEMERIRLQKTGGFGAMREDAPPMPWAEGDFTKEPLAILQGQAPMEGGGVNAQVPEQAMQVGPAGPVPNAPF